MPTTTNLGLRYPVSSDPATIATYLKNLADDTEARMAAVQAFTASGTIAAQGARMVTFTGAAGQTLTMPAGVAGQAFEVWNIDTSDSVTIARAGTDTFDGGGTSFTLLAGFGVRLRCLATGVWYREILCPADHNYGQVIASAHEQPGSVIAAFPALTAAATTPSVAVKAGRQYKVSGFVVYENGASGAHRTVYVEVRHNGTALGSPSPANPIDNLHSPNIAGIGTPLAAPVEFIWTPTANATGTFVLGIAASAGSSCFAREGSLNVTAA